MMVHVQEFISLFVCLFSFIIFVVVCIKGHSNSQNDLDSTSVTDILKNTTTLLNFRDLFRCFKHHLQP